MDDQKFLKHFITILEQFTQGVPNQIIGIKDLASKHVYCSKYFAALLGISQEETIGKVFGFDDAKGKILNLAATNMVSLTRILVEDQAIIKNRAAQAFLKIIKLKDGMKPKIFIKSPLINPSTNNVVGIVFQGIEWGLVNFNQLMLKVQEVFKPLNKANKQLPKLTKREKQVIFFFLIRLSSQEIADFLYRIEGRKISKSTIDSLFIDQLYIKFNVVNRQALYAKLIKLGYDRFIPQDVLISMSLPLEKPTLY